MLNDLTKMQTAFSVFWVQSLVPVAMVTKSDRVFLPGLSYILGFPLRLTIQTTHIQWRQRILEGKQMKVLSRNESPYLGKFVTDVVVPLFQVLYTPVRVLLSVPPIMHHNEPERESLTQLKQVVSLLSCPAVVMEILLVLQIRVNWNLWLLLKQKWLKHL